MALGVGRAEAQTASQPAGRLEVSVGAGWLGGASFGEQPADLRGASGSPYRLFESETSLRGTGLFEARAGFALTRRYTIEGRAAMSKPELQTVVSSDAEASGSFTAVESIDQYIFDAGVLVRLDELESFGLKPFAIGGFGYVRQLHDDQQLVETGTPLLRRRGSHASALLACAGIHPKRKHPGRSAAERPVARARRGQPVAGKRVSKSRPHVLALDLASVICSSSVIREELPSRYHRESWRL